MSTTLIHGVAVRKTNSSDNSYAVWPVNGGFFAAGVVEVQCYAVHVHKSRLPELDSMDMKTFSKGAGLPVSVSLGPYCLEQAKFLNCVMHCPPAYESTEEEIATASSKRARDQETALMDKVTKKPRRKWGEML